MTRPFDLRAARAAWTTLFAVIVAAGCASHPPTERSVPPQRAPAATPSTIERNVPRVAPPTAIIDGASRRCLALTMYWEARGESRLGMEAVAAVVLNRVADRRFPDTVCGVVYQGGETPPCQFSWWCDGRSDAPTQRAAWETSLELADLALTGALRDPTHGALYFSQRSIRQPATRIRTARIGNHVFYK